jgi:glycine/D-amino acid oxidase-like deaminating enzyme
MRIASKFALSAYDVEQLRPATILVMTDPVHQDDASLLEFLADEGIDILITDRTPASHILGAWRAAQGRPLVVLVSEALGNSECIPGHCDDAIIVFFGDASTPISKALTLAENIYTRQITAKRALDALGARGGKRAESVLVVGAGIVSLMTALHLIENGYQVELVEKSGDPRVKPHWLSLGCTHGGENARMFSLTECDNYHDREVLAEAQLHGQINRSITEMGWLIGHPQRYQEQEREWMEHFSGMPIFLANKYNEDIFALNHESFKYWNKLILDRPELFESVEFRRNLLRVTSTAAYHKKQLARQKWAGSYIRELETGDVADHYPSLAAGCLNGEIAGGIEVAGFSLNVHDFVNNLINRLEASDVKFHWGKEARGIGMEDGTVTGIVMDDTLWTSDHYFLSPGVYGSDLLNGTDSANKIHGILGAWISFPNLEPKLTRSLKISRDGHIANSGNIIPARSSTGKDILIFGSGFGYLGRDLSNVDDEQLSALFESMESYIEAMFPAAYRRAMRTGELRESRRYCIRPWTASSLGVFEIMQATSGLVIVASGHNTGGFSQSTSVARATVDALQGRVHPMHILYHPRRFEDFCFPRPAREKGARLEACAAV